jgi:hypothetical protein
VAGYAGVGGERKSAKLDIEITVANAAGMDLDEHLAGTRLRAGTFFNSNGSVGLVNDGCFHGASDVLSGPEVERTTQRAKVGEARRKARELRAARTFRAR